MNTILKDTRELWNAVNRTYEGTKQYLLVSDFGTSAVASEAGLIANFFRLFTPVKAIQGRKLNAFYGEPFNPYKNSLMDYPTIVQFKLGKVGTNALEKYNKLVSVHTPRCPLNCWHCYLDDCLKAQCKNCESGTFCEKKQRAQFGIKEDWFTAKGILEEFLRQREADRSRNIENNIIRITGGEPYLVPDLIVELLTEIEKSGLSSDIFVWTETNLIPFIVSDEDKAIVSDEHIRELSKFKNFCIHPCFHGLNCEEFSNITGKSIDDYELVLRAFKRLVDGKLDVYPTFGSNMVSATNIETFYGQIEAINKNLPLRFCLVEYDLDYRPIKWRRKNIPNFIKKHEMVFDRYLNIDIWSGLLKNRTGKAYAEIPRHLINL